MTVTEALDVGAAMPDVSLRDLHGRVCRLADYRGQPVLIFMWASW
jgi:peroxiredoxin